MATTRPPSVRNPAKAVRAVAAAVARRVAADRLAAVADRPRNNLFKCLTGQGPARTSAPFAQEAVRGRSSVG